MSHLQGFEFQAREGLRVHRDDPVLTQISGNTKKICQLAAEDINSDI